MNVKKLKGFLRVAGPTICGCLGSVGVVVTAVLSAKGALKANTILNDNKLSAKEKAKQAAPAFIPAGLSGAATIGFIFAANVLGQNQQAALIAGLAPPSVLEFRYNPDGKSPQDDFLTFYDPFAKRYFERTINEVLEAEYHLNRNFILRGYAPLNELYDFLSLDKTNDGEKLGWSRKVNPKVNPLVKTNFRQILSWIAGYGH